MKDVTAIQEDKKTFTIVSHARTMILEATTAAEHNSWLAELHRACPQLRRAESRESSSTVATSSAASAKDHQSPPVHRPSAKSEDAGAYMTLNHETLQSLDAKSSNISNTNNTMDRSVSLFSRHAQGEKNSFYNAQGKPNVPIAHSASGEENYREEELITLQPDLGRSTDSISGLLEREQRQPANSSKNNQNAINMLNNHSGSRDRDRDGHPPRPRTDSRGHFPANNRDNMSHDETDNVSEGSGGRRSASNHTQDDHRKHGFRHGGDSTSSTSRLHRHIAQQSNAQDREEYYPANVTTTSASNSRQTSANSNKNNTMTKSHSGDDHEYSHHRSETKESGDDEEVEDVSLRVRRRPSSRASRDEFDSSEAPVRNAFSDSTSTNSSSKNNVTSSGANSSSNNSLARKFSKKAPPPPSVAPPPPRRARDTSLTVLDNDDSNSNNANSTENSGSNVTRKSIDAILFSGNSSIKAEEKSSSVRVRGLEHLLVLKVTLDLRRIGISSQKIGTRMILTQII